MAVPGHGQYQQMIPQQRDGQQQPGAAYPGVAQNQGGLQQGQQIMVTHSPQQVPPPPGPTTVNTPMMSPVKEPNAITLCKRGQEFVQDIVQKVTEIFKQMQTKQMPLPNGVNYSNQLYQDRKVKLDEHLQTLSMGLKKLRLFYDKVNELSADIDHLPEDALIPISGQSFEDITTSQSEAYYKYVSDENREIVEQLHAKNIQLKEIIDQMRTVIWEINTMIVMRKT